MSSKEPRGLGKGLSALLGDAPDVDQLRKPVGYVNKEIIGTRSRQNSSDIFRIPADMIVPNPFQPRFTFDEEALEELAASIRTLGLIQPITVRKIAGGRYQIISGERRFRACRMAGMPMIPAYVRDADDVAMLEMAIVENIQREDLDPIEEAMSFQRLIDECSLTQEQMAERLAKKRSTVTNALRLLKLPVKVQHDLKEGLITVGHAKVLLGLEDHRLQERLCDMIIQEDLSVRQLEQQIRLAQEGNTPARKSATGELPAEYTQLGEKLGSFFQRGVSLRRSAGGKGSMTVRFDSDEEVRAFLEALDSIPRR